MGMKSKILSAIVNHPKLVTFGIVLAVTFGISLATGLVSLHEALASGGQCAGCI